VALLAAAAVIWFLWPSHLCCAPPPIDIEAYRDAQAIPPLPNKPIDFAITIEHGTGSVAPRFHYDYELSVDSLRWATLKYWPGYGKNDSLRVEARFQVEQPVFYMIYEASARLVDAPGPVPPRDRREGASSPRFTLRSFGRTHVVEPGQPEAWIPLVDSVATLMRNAIPNKIWERCQQANARRDDGRDEGRESFDAR